MDHFSTQTYYARVREMARSQRGQIWLLASVVLAIGLFYALLVMAYLDPLNAFWSTDQGVKLVQTQSLILTKFHTSALVYPGITIDPNRQFMPFRGQYLVQGEQVFGMFPQAFSAVSAPFLFVFGYGGLYIVPVLAACAALFALALLGKRVLPLQWNIALVVAVGLCSPLIFYATNFWEHTTALCLVLFALLFSVHAIDRSQLAMLFAAGLCVGLAVWFRNETALVFPALLLGIWCAAGVVRFWGAIWLGIGGALAIGPLLFFNQTTYGAMLGAHVVVTGAAQRRDWLSWAEFLLVPSSSVFVLFLLFALILLWALSIYSNKLRNDVRLHYGFCLLVAALLLQIAPPSNEDGYTSLLTGCPLLLLCLLPVSARPRMSTIPPAVRLLSVFSVSFILCCWLARLPDGGVQQGPRMLLPAIVPLLLVGMWRARNWLAQHTVPRAVTACLLTLAVVGYASATAQIGGMRQLRMAMNANYQVLDSAAQSQQQVIVTDTWPAPALLAPLIYDGHLVFLVDSGKSLDEFMAALRAKNIHQFYYLGIFDAAIARDSQEWAAVKPVGKRRALAYQLRGQSFIFP